MIIEIWQQYFMLQYAQDGAVILLKMMHHSIFDSNMNKICWHLKNYPESLYIFQGKMKSVRSYNRILRISKEFFFIH